VENKNVLDMQLELVEQHYPEALDPKNRDLWLTYMLSAISGEIGEAQSEYHSFPWKPSKFDRDKVFEELIDIQHFLLEAYLIIGIRDWKEVEDKFSEKLERNKGRGRVHQKDSHEHDKSS
jgi:dimeric dUTPase (all-alpha-NTP-PPase superfamily)